ncbi:MAG: uracil-DNA glycosylase [Chloroflexota bacterium]|nr:uracil-DNA glycosylase [Dehalococcoidia bacterium]MDW8253755.1 uracil-DNA glycosylase [Chloroflexota bacterium]
MTTAAERLAALESEMKACRRCPLAEARTRVVPGEGPVNAEVLFIGEAPGFNEDRQGRPFVGQAGQLLTELLQSIGLRREDVYITNVVKCRPPNNRDPLPNEIAACRPWLEAQLQVLAPLVICTLGRHSMARYFKASISRIHGQPAKIGEVWVMPFFHPAAALHNQALRPALFEDFQKLPALLERARAERRAKATAAPEPPPEPKQLSLF